DYRSWEGQIRGLARLYRNVTWNYRGYPPSSVPDDPAAYSQEQLVADLLGLLDHLGVERAHLVGLSMGGSLVLAFALAHPEPCREPALFLKRQISGSGLLVLPQSGHTINLEEPATFNAAVLSFFQSVEADRWAVRQDLSTSLLPEDARG